MILVPVTDTASQTLQAQLANQSFTLNVYQKSAAPNYSNGPAIYMDVLINGVIVLGGIVCWNLNRLIRNAYFGVVGDFCWVDTQGTNDPTTPGLGSRYQLIYLEAADLGSLFS